jgi:hypothetical protein
MLNTTLPSSIVFLVDVDDTLLENDRIQDDLRAHMEREFGPECRDRFWVIQEALFQELGYRDYLGKFFLHISKEEQLRRFKRRLDDPKRHWKISDADYKERKFWDAYTEAYEEALSRCNTERAPWYIIPSDCKWFRNLAVAQIVVHHLEGLKLQLPVPTVDLDTVRKEYEDAEKEAATRHHG